MVGLLYGNIAFPVLPDCLSPTLCYHGFCRVHTTLERKKRGRCKDENHASARNHQHDIEEEFPEGNEKHQFRTLFFIFIFYFFCSITHQPKSLPISPSIEPNLPTSIPYLQSHPLPPSSNTNTNTQPRRPKLPRRCSSHSILHPSHRLRASPQIPLDNLRRRIARAQHNQRNKQRQKPGHRSQDHNDFHALFHLDVHEQRDGQDFEEEGEDEECVCGCQSIILVSEQKIQHRMG
jgi:hypothetical protein